MIIRDGTTNNVGGDVAADRSKDALKAARFDPTQDTFNNYFAVQNRGQGKMPGYMFSSRNHTNELVPLWAMGAGAEMFSQFTRTDLKAAKLWGEQYGWDGNFVDNTSVFSVMKEAFENEVALIPAQ